MKSRILIGLLGLVLLCSAVAYGQTTNPGTFRAPTIKTGAVATSIYWTAGSINNGGHTVAVAAGSAALGASRTSCAPPVVGATCDFLYFNSSGTGAVTNDYFTANAVGNTIAAFIETSAGSVPTSIVLPQQSNLVWNASPAPHVGYTAAAGAAGTVRLIRAEATTGATMTSGNLVGVRGAVTAATGSTISAGTYLYGVQGKAITGTGDISAAQFTGVYGQLDVSGGTLTAGHISAISGNIYGFGSGSSSLLNILYLEAAGGGVINSHIQMFGKAAYVFDIQTNSHAPEANTSCTPSAVTGATGGISVIVDGVPRWIPLAATCT